MQIARARAEVYHLLAELLADPRESLGHAELAALNAAAQALDSPACRDAATAFARWIPLSAADLRARYDCVLHAPGRPPALYESQIRGHLGGPTAAAVERLYRVWGLYVADGEIADHVSVELAFLAHLVAGEVECRGVASGASVGSHAGGDEVLPSLRPPTAAAVLERLRFAQRTFWHEHVVCWLPSLGRTLAAGGDEFYAAVGRWLAAFLAEEAWRFQAPHAAEPGCINPLDHESRSSAPPRHPATVTVGVGHRGGGRRVPTLGDAPHCTLCGFCVQVCAPHALWVDESATTTRLMLDAARCVGCALCLKICPERTLRMIRPDAAEAVPRALRVSPRAQCPICAAPTVSVAELDAVLARVSADDELREHLSLCVDCKTFAEAWQ